MSESTQPLAFIIEDDSKLAAIFSQAMKMAGFDVQQTANGQDALAALADITPQIILLDLHLPGMGGDKLLANIRQDARLGKTIVILTTSDSVMADSLKEQSDYVLLKPVSFSQLRDLGIRLRSTLGK